MSVLKYRPDIDGLRALAVILVLLYHADLWDVNGGYVGVDVFFVISGFLITSLILADLKKGTFSFLDFWERRIRRILPALAICPEMPVLSADILAVVAGAACARLPKHAPARMPSNAAMVKGFR